MVDELQSLYLDVIRKHAADPVGLGLEIEPTHQHEEYNPQCGDRILIKLRIAAGQIEAAAFEGEACAICMASASLLCECVPGRESTYLLDLRRDLESMLKTGEESVEAETLTPLRGVRPYPSRIRCATLPWSAACAAL